MHAAGYMKKRGLAVRDARTPDELVTEAPSLTLRAEVRAASIDLEARTVEVVFSTGAPVERYDWMTGGRYIETLAIKADAIRFGRLNNSAPFLNAHSAYAIENVLGVVVPGSARVTGGEAVARVRFSKREDVEEIWSDVVDGILRHVSVGYRVHKYEQTETQGKLPIRLAIDWEPYEISAVPMGADDDALVRAARNAHTHPCVIVTRSLPEDRTMRKMTCLDCKAEHQDDPAVTACPACQSRNLQRAVSAPPEPRQPGNPGDPGAPTAPAVTASEHQVATTERQGGVVEERARVEGIMRAVTSLNLPVEMAQRFIRDGISLEDAQAAAIEEASRRGAGDQGPRFPVGGSIEMGRDRNSHVRAGIENALLHRIKPDWFKLDDLGKLYANRRMIGLAECWLQSCGIRTTAMSTLDIAGVALGLNMRQGLHTTSDFANILADVMGKTLRRAYEEAPQTFLPLVSRKEIVDFKPVKRTQISEAPALDLVNENGEFTSGTMGDAKEQYQLATYGKTFGITRQAMVNDDLEAFTSLAIKFGRSARQKESELVWAQITSNPNMGDGVALFHATHLNLSGTSDAIAVASIGAAWAAMGLQKGLAGVEFLNITPAFLIVPKAKETLAKQFVSTNLLASQPSSVNPFAGVLTVISDPRLDASSTVSWYLAAPVSQVDIIELGFLAGEGGPMVESQIGFKVDGIEVKCRHDVAAKVIDWRGLYKNPGA